MNILLINHYAGSKDMGMEFRPSYLAEEWNLTGNKTVIIAGKYSHLRKKNPIKIAWDSIDGIPYFWLWTNKYKGNGASRFLSMLVFVLQLLLLAPYFAFKVRPNVVIASSTYTIDIFPAWLIAKLSNAQLVFEIHDLWPLSPMELGKMHKFHPFILIMRFGEWFAYKFSDKIVSMLPNTFEHVKKDGVLKKNWAYVPNGVAIPKNKIKLTNDKIVKNKSFKIGYAGGFNISNDMMHIIKAANLLKNHDIVFYMIGDGTELKKMKQIADSKKVIFIDKMTKEEVFAYLASMDVLFIAMQKQPLYRFGISPNKIFDYMLAARPILQAIESGNDLIKEANCGMTIAPENTDAIVDAILKLSKMPKIKLDKLGKNGYEFVTKNHNFTKLAKDFLNHVKPIK